MNYPSYGPKIDTQLLSEQADWSEKNFGPGNRTKGLIEHIKKELEEIEAEPLDLEEWIDVAILAFDGAWRTGASEYQVLAMYRDKLRKNFARQYPDWRDFTEDQAIEHIR